MKAALIAHKPELVDLLAARRKAAAQDIGEACAPAAVLLSGTLMGDVWLIADDEVLIEHPDIEASRLPTFTFSEVPYLARLDDAALAAVSACKRAFPTGRILK